MVYPVMKKRVFTPRQFRSYIFSWWKKNARDLPWRHTSDPYAILVSEVMLQQTQVSRVLEKYDVFLGKYPTVFSLADAPASEIIRDWKGLGYNRRALYLHRSARIVVEKYKGIFPKSETELLSIPGIGKYTARAILVFAFRHTVAMVDTNIRKIITHFFYDDRTQPESVIWETANRLVPKGKSWEWHQALMDYGALELAKQTGKNPARSIRRKKTVPFNQTNRFLRGRILDALRVSPRNDSGLVSEMVRTCKRPESVVRDAVEQLIREGLCERTGAVLSLPQ